jgi:hypothetical protein
VPGPTFFITGKDKGKLGYFWEHVYLKAKSGPNLGGVVNPDSGVAILDSEMQKLTALDFTDKLKVSEALTAPQRRHDAVLRAVAGRPAAAFSAWRQSSTSGRYMRGWFDFAIADELHQLAGDTAQGNGLACSDARRKIDRAHRHADGRLRRRPLQQRRPFSRSKTSRTTCRATTRASSRSRWTPILPKRTRSWRTIFARRCASTAATRA